MRITVEITAEHANLYGKYIYESKLKYVHTYMIFVKNKIIDFENVPYPNRKSSWSPIYIFKIQDKSFAVFLQRVKRSGRKCKKKIIEIEQMCSRKKSARRINKDGLH